MGNVVRIWENRITGKLSSGKTSCDDIPLKLVYDATTKVVYFKFSEILLVSKSKHHEEYDTKAGYMSPYISENGKYCRFIDNQIIEIG